MILPQSIGKLHYNVVYKFVMLWISAKVLHFSTVHISYCNNITVIYSGIFKNIILNYNIKKCNCLFTIRTQCLVI